MAEMEIRNIRLPPETWRRYIEIADVLEYAAVSDLGREALEFYLRHVASKLEKFNAPLPTNVAMT